MAEKQYKIKTELIEGGGGVYKVWVDGDLIWDKKAAGRFPEESEVLGKIAEKRGG